MYRKLSDFETGKIPKDHRRGNQLEGTPGTWRTCSPRYLCVFITTSRRDSSTDPPGNQKQPAAVTWILVRRLSASQLPQPVHGAQVGGWHGFGAHNDYSTQPL